MDSFYDMSAGELRDLWESDLDPEAISETFGRGGSHVDEELPDWATGLSPETRVPIVLHDHLMTDAALGTLPIKSEHSYSLASDGDSGPDSPLSRDVDDDCFPCVRLDSATSRLCGDPSSSVKEEPLSEPASPTSSSEPASPASPPPAATASAAIAATAFTTADAKVCGQQSVLKQPALLLATRGGSLLTPTRVVIPKLSIKLEGSAAAAAGFALPPTPPSSAGSDTEGNTSPPHQSVSAAAASAAAAAAASAPRLPGRPPAATRIYLPAAGTATVSSGRQPIHTPLISCQPKGSTGTLLLTEEEKRTLLAEGYPIPTRLPLTKAEEKSLKKIRRKIKNKISAQESRRKKKEYMDALERKVESLASENSDYKRKIESLEDSNASLMTQLQKLQQLVARSSLRTVTAPLATSTQMGRATIK
ncbi:hypothetical protein R5R35_011809 [Gryllus longicercus]|uniref:BZIP domain-containing protein n=1 Tax=Gryllus longicercus TaxID=2509291 RepID=A0AAN9VXR4_9ORTH